MFTHYYCPSCQVGSPLGVVCCGAVIHAGLPGFVARQEVIMPGYAAPYGFVDPLLEAEAVEMVLAAEVAEEIIEDIVDMEYGGGYGDYGDYTY